MTEVPDQTALFDWLGFIEGVLTSWLGQAAKMLLSAGSPFSLAALSCALCIACFFTLTRARRATRRSVRIKVLCRALFPRRLWRSASGRADILFTFFNIFLAMMLFGWAILSAGQVDGLAQRALTAAFGPASPRQVPDAAVVVVVTIALYLAYELAYWFDHFLSHKIPFLWRFHMMHHSAETLSPLTSFRVHPVDTIVFYNIVAVTLGVTQAGLAYGFGREASAFAVEGSNVLVLAGGILLNHLQHSHLWISFTGPLGRLVLSPAHHQIHHSADTRHFDRNFGNSLAVWDWLFGTLHVPAKEREKLRFGVAVAGHDPHNAVAALVMPGAGALAALVKDAGRVVGALRGWQSLILRRADRPAV